jgi:hypothetical protein
MRPSVDQARLRPHLRERAQLEQRQTDGFQENDRTDAATPHARLNDEVMVDPFELRGLPILAPGVQGVAPGTDPVGA